MAGIYKKIGDKIAANPDIIRPHVKALDITHLNFKKMKEMGMERVMINKDNILTKVQGDKFIDDRYRDSLLEMIKTFN